MLRFINTITFEASATALSSRSDDAMTKAIFLDVGGTLLEMGDPESAYADILDQYGYPSTREEIGAWIRKAQEEAGPVVSSGSGPRG